MHFHVKFIEFVVKELMAFATEMEWQFKLTLVRKQRNQLEGNLLC